MKQWIALFRGINVGGKNSLPMKSLVHAMQNIELMNIRTYIQSGNVIFQCDKTEKAELLEQIGNLIKNRFGFRPQMILLTIDELREAISFNPYPKSESEPKSLHLYFLNAPPVDPDFQLLESMRSKKEQFKLINSVFYLHAPDGIGRSKLAANVEKGLGVFATARNWRTVTQIVSMGEQEE
jgi:uncharacterized protein (DUF1697 family)